MFPEPSLTGYYPADLLDGADFVRVDAGLQRLRYCHPCHAGLHCDRRTYPPRRPGKHLQNCLLVLADGKLVLRLRQNSCCRPTTSSTKAANFEPGPDVGCVLRIGDCQIGFLICEDGWNDEGRITRSTHSSAGRCRARIWWPINASPSNIGKREGAPSLFAAASRHKLPLLYVNQIGGYDQLVSDGASFAVTPQQGGCSRRSVSLNKP